MRLFIPLIRSKFTVLFLVVLFIKSFILPYSIFAGEKKEKNSKNLFSVSVWSSERLVKKETTKSDLLLSSNVFSNNTQGLSIILYQKPLEGEPEFVKKKGSKVVYYILGIAIVAGAGLAIGMKGGGTGGGVRVEPDLPGPPDVPIK